MVAVRGSAANKWTQQYRLSSSSHAALFRTPATNCFPMTEVSGQATLSPFILEIQYHMEIVWMRAH